MHKEKNISLLSMKNNYLTARTEANFLSSDRESEAYIDCRSEGQLDESLTPLNSRMVSKFKC
jgi:hypothetical protein